MILWPVLWPRYRTNGYELSIGAENFMKILDRYGGPDAAKDWEKLSSFLRPMASGIMGIPSTAVRPDPGVLLTLGAKYPREFINVLKYASQITEPFDLAELGVKNDFLRNYLDLLAFLLQGLPANQTLTAVMGYIVEDFFPKGGSGELMGTLARGITKHNRCSVETSAGVEEVLIENGCAVGVKLEKSGKTIRAKEAVVSNADLYHTFQLVPEGKSDAFRTPHPPRTSHWILSGTRCPILQIICAPSPGHHVRFSP